MLCTLLGCAKGSIPGKQTVPRSEITAILHALITTNGDCIYVCDSKSVARIYNKGHYAEPIVNGLLWNLVNKARISRAQRGGGTMTVVWRKAHIDIATAIASPHIDNLEFSANLVADKIAGLASSEAQLLPQVVAHQVSTDKQLRAILERLVQVALFLVPSDPKRAHAPSCGIVRESKQAIISKLASEAGHRLDGNSVCVKCGLFAKPSLNVAYLEAILHLKCVGTKASISLVNMPGSDAGVFMLGPIPAHSSHSIATSGPLRIHFCCFCGSYSHITKHSRSRGLALPCPNKPSTFGRRALLDIERGLDPSRFLVKQIEKYGRNKSSQRNITKPYHVQSAKLHRSKQSAAGVDDGVPLSASCSSQGSPLSIGTKKEKRGFAHRCLTCQLAELNGVSLGFCVTCNSYTPDPLNGPSSSQTSPNAELVPQQFSCSKSAPSGSDTTAKTAKMGSLCEVRKRSKVEATCSACRGKPWTLASPCRVCSNI